MGGSASQAQAQDQPPRQSDRIASKGAAAAAGKGGRAKGNAGSADDASGSAAGGGGDDGSADLSKPQVEDSPTLLDTLKALAQQCQVSERVGVYKHFNMGF